FANRLRRGGRAVRFGDRLRHGLPHDDLRGVLVLALQAPRLEVGARARMRLDVHRVRADASGRRHDPARAVEPLYAGALSQFRAAFLSCIHDKYTTTKVYTRQGDRRELHSFPWV